MIRPIEPSAPMLELIAFAYQAAQDEALWPDLASRIAGAFAAASSALVALGETDTRVLSKTPDIDDGWISEYRFEYARLIGDAIDDRLPSLKATEAAAASPETTNIRAWSCGSQIGKDESYQGIGTLVSLPSGEDALLGIHRYGAATAFDGVDRRQLAQFLPHLRNALQVRARLERPRTDPWNNLEQADVAVVAVARDARILRRNVAAEVLLNRRDGIHVVHGRLSGPTRQDTERLRATIVRVVDSGERGVEVANTLLLPREGALPLSVSVRLLLARFDDMSENGHCAVLFFADPDKRPLARAGLQSLFGLTPAEAAVANELSMGKTPDEIAACLSIRSGTVRTHLKSIYAKSGTKRQAEFVALLLRCLAPLAWHPFTNFG